MKTVRKRPKPIYVVYRGTAQERLFNRALVDRPEGKYVFEHNLPTRIDPLPVMDGTELVRPMVAVGGGDLEEIVWATDNLDYYRGKAERNPETWAVFERKPSKRELAVLMGEAEAEPEPAPKKVEPAPTPEKAKKAKKAPENG